MEFIFLPKHYLNTLKDRDITLEELVKVILNTGQDNNKFSNFSKCFFYEINRFFNYAILNINKERVLFNLTDIERSSLKDKIEETIRSKSYYDYDDIKYYEFLRFSGDTILIVFSEGFVDFVTKSKENFLEFLLSLLCYLYDVNLTSEEVIKNYILFKNKDTSIEYLKVKLV